MVSSESMNSIDMEQKVVFKGKYTEKLKSGGELVVYSRGWEISYYFPGLDRRYNGTFVTVPGDKIDEFISAWKNNFQKYKELMAVIPSNGNFETSGEMGMSIRIGLCEGVNLKSYHMPIKSEEKLQEVVRDYEYAKLQASILRKLFE